MSEEPYHLLKMDPVVEVEDFNNEVTDAIEQIEQKLSRINQGLGREKDIEECKNQITHTKNRLKQMEMARREITQSEVAKKYTPMVRQHKAKLKELENELEVSSAGKTLAQADKLQEKYGDITKNEDAAIAYGREIQDRTHAAADDAIAVMVETQAIAAETAEKVHDQTEQIAKIDEKLSEIDNEIDRAVRVMRVISRRLMTDKYLSCLIGTVFIAIVAVIIVASVTGKSKTKTPDF